MPKQESPLKTGLIRVGAVIFWLLVWQIAAWIVDTAVLLPSPVQTLSCLWRIGGQAEFWLRVFGSILRVLSGFVLGLLTGSFLAFAAVGSGWLEKLLAPLIACLKSVPVASFIILANFWLRAQEVTVFISFLMVLPLTYRSILEGLKGRDQKLLEMAACYGLNRIQRIYGIDFPAVLGPLRSVCSVGLGFAWKAGVAAEVIALVPGSIGEALYDAKVYLNTEELFAWTLVVVILSILLEALITRFLKKEVAK